ncbi:lactosylceramide 4-alpha-galactosyltransferase [Telopea speciosissima]|uniref:lactosylceramide 4-alpha-galactosyltransferase n=1 Tax=Telopea speciosissima TaxID=54955 RepID=UPI001CC67482|nr:lactosylceramide 4-alpha-galactosyltransferase [Telopea speciosissima]
MAIDEDITDPSGPSSLPLHFHQIKTSLSAFLCCIPTSFLVFFLLVLMFYSGASNLSVQVRISPQIPLESDSFSPENVLERAARNFSSSSNISVVKEEIPRSKMKTHLPLRQELESSVLPLNSSKPHRPRAFKRRKTQFMILQPTAMSMQFSTRVKKFFHTSSLNSSASPCKVRFFMTWISSSLESFGPRELISIESLFKSHPNACLLILSNSMDSRRGVPMLKPFLEKGFRVTAIPPNFDYIFKNTPAEAWFDRLKNGKIDPGQVSLGQNLSNLLRLAVLYKFGGVYIDTDVIILKSFSNLRNVIGAQTLNLQTGNWSRLNNAVLIFDRKHPLLLKFIEEFALTFDGSKWGHNGPYLVSRVVSRMTGQPGFNFTVLPPPAFYPVEWSRVQSLFQSSEDDVHSKWVSAKLRYIRRQSMAVHLWNKHSRKLKVEEGSVIGHIMLDYCIFCNTTRLAS